MLIAVSEIVQIFQNEDDDISIALKNGDVIVTANTYAEIKNKLQTTLVNKISSKND